MARWKLAALALTLWAAGGLSRMVLAADLVEPAKIDALVKPLIDGAWVNGLSIALVDERGTQFAGYGAVSANDNTPPTPDTEFEIGSISKTFTGLILARMIEDGTVRLDEPVQNLLGETMTLPLRDERPITLVDLATHSSGLPRLPTNLLPKDVGNPYADYTVEQMGKFLGGHKLRRKPGEKSEYSNLGMGLLGHALAVKSGLPYEELLRTTVCGPLGMADTVIALDASQRARLAEPHDSDGKVVANWDIPALAGAGAIRSTAADLVKYLAAQVQLVETPLAPAIRLSQQLHFDNGEKADNDVGLAWMLQRKPHVIWHNGGTGGYSSYAGFSPDKKQGVVVLGNTSSAYVTTLGIRLVALLTTGEARPLEVPTIIPITVDELEPLVGSYELAPQMVAKVTREGDRLFVQLTGQPRISLYPETKTRFRCRPVDASFDFESDDEGGPVTRMVIHQFGRDIPAQRTE